MRIYVPDMELVGTLKFAKELFGRIPDDDEVVADEAEDTVEE